MTIKFEYKNKLLYELTNNSRIQRKELSKKLKVSQQQINYSLNRLLTEQIISFKTIIDPARFNYMALIVNLVFTTNNNKIKNQIIKELQENNNISSIIKLSGGADLKIEYIIPNLSFFNKIFTEQLDKYKTEIKIIDLYPIIVKHLFNKKYLNKKLNQIDHKVICGDRETYVLNNKEKEVIKILIKEPTKSINQISKETNIDQRTINKIIKKLTKENVIKGFTANIDLEKIGLSSEILLIKLHDNKLKKLNNIAEICSSIPEVIQIYKLLGEIDILLITEYEEPNNNIINKIREKIGFYDYKSYKLNKIIKEESFPKELIEII